MVGVKRRSRVILQVRMRGIRERNDAGAIIDWRFSTRDARSKLKHVYPIELN